MRQKVTDAQIIKALKQTGGNQSAAARKLNVCLGTIRKRLLGIDSRKIRALKIALLKASSPKAKRPPELDDPLWQEFWQKPDSLPLQNRLATRYLELAEKTMWRVRQTLPKHADLDALGSGAHYGLLEAIRHFDPLRKVRFETYAVPLIRGRIFDELRKADDRPRRVRSLQRQRMDAKESLQKELDRRPTETEIADFLEWTQGELDESRARETVSIHKRQFETETGRVMGLAESLVDFRAQPKARQERLDFYWRILQGLNIEEQIIIYLSFAKGVTLKEIAKCLCLSESRVSQMRAASLESLKNWRKKDVCYDEVGEL